MENLNGIILVAVCASSSIKTCLVTADKVDAILRLQHCSPTTRLEKSVVLSSACQTDGFEENGCRFSQDFDAKAVRPVFSSSVVQSASAFVSMICGPGQCSYLVQF